MWGNLSIKSQNLYHPLTQEIFIKYLLCIKHCLRIWESWSEHKEHPCPHEAYIVIIKNKQKVHLKYMYIRCGECYGPQQIRVKTKGIGKFLESVSIII